MAKERRSPLGRQEAGSRQRKSQGRRQQPETRFLWAGPIFHSSTTQLPAAHPCCKVHPLGKTVTIFMRSVVPAYLWADLLYLSVDLDHWFCLLDGLGTIIKLSSDYPATPPKQFYALIVCGLRRGQEFMGWWRLREGTSSSQPCAEPLSMLDADLPSWQLWGYPCYRQ